jgi:hypothetical protein
VYQDAGYTPARVLIDYSGEATDITAGIMITIVISRWKSPPVPTIMRIRIRYLTFIAANNMTEFYYKRINLRYYNHRHHTSSVFAGDQLRVEEK